MSGKRPSQIVWDNLRWEAWEKTKGVCSYCGTDIAQKFCVDHVIPIDMGGTYDIENLLPCCGSCNSSKSNRTLEQFREVLSRRIHKIPPFTEEQKDWLAREHGVDVTPPTITFWFEENGIALSALCPP